MRGLKGRLAQALFRSGSLSALRALLRGRLVVFNYHRLRRDPSPGGAEERTPFDETTFGPTRAQFFEHVEWLKRHATILSEEELCEHLAARGRPPRHAAMITFDDGYRDNHDLALPVLRDLGVPAIFFVTSGFVEERRVGWWDLIAFLLRRSPRPSIAFEGQTFDLRGGFDAAAGFFTRKMKLEPAGATADLLERLARACEVALPDREFQGREMMTWDQLREAARQGIAIGSHTHTHRVLATLERVAVVEELVRSRALLEERLGRPVRSISYPVGEYRHLPADIGALARHAGYELGFSYFTGGLNRWDHIDRYDIKRVDGPEDLAAFATLSVIPELRSWEPALLKRLLRR